ncbi:hypothetical protein BD410DRAFT_625000 [Rickenella mellea]|uniref:Uncharacterized protein n=1 Tax=Rickenella mellea TaxID=50990 RepID=A0A4Y7PPJ7_9AGAM|nr:hypothetical protein BD410DRAFT_625000 [Rickenella mellea]
MSNLPYLQTYNPPDSVSFSNAAVTNAYQTPEETGTAAQYTTTYSFAHVQQQHLAQAHAFGVQHQQQQLQNHDHHGHHPQHHNQLEQQWVDQARAQPFLHHDPQPSSHEQTYSTESTQFDQLPHQQHQQHQHQDGYSNSFSDAHAADTHFGYTHDAHAQGRPLQGVVVSNSASNSNSVGASTASTSAHASTFAFAPPISNGAATAVTDGIDVNAIEDQWHQAWIAQYNAEQAQAQPQSHSQQQQHLPQFEVHHQSQPQQRFDDGYVHRVVDMHEQLHQHQQQYFPGLELVRQQQHRQHLQHQQQHQELAQLAQRQQFVQAGMNGNHAGIAQQGYFQENEYFVNGIRDTMDVDNGAGSSSMGNSDAAVAGGAGATGGEAAVRPVGEGGEHADVEQCPPIVPSQAPHLAPHPASYHLGGGAEEYHASVGPRIGSAVADANANGMVGAGAGVGMHRSTIPPARTYPLPIPNPRKRPRGRTVPAPAPAESTSQPHQPPAPPAQPHNAHQQLQHQPQHPQHPQHQHHPLQELEPHQPPSDVTSAPALAARLLCVAQSAQAQIRSASESVMHYALVRGEREAAGARVAAAVAARAGAGDVGSGSGSRSGGGGEGGDSMDGGGAVQEERRCRTSRTRSFPLPSSGSSLLESCINNHNKSNQHPSATQTPLLNLPLLPNRLYCLPLPHERDRELDDNAPPTSNTQLGTLSGARPFRRERAVHHACVDRREERAWVGDWSWRWCSFRSG